MADLITLIAAHQLKQSYWNWWGCTGCDWRTKDAYGSEPTAETVTEHAKHVVEQHTNGRIAELEAELAEAKDDKFYARVELNADMQWKDRAEKAEATIARVEKLQGDLFQQGGNLIAQWGAARLIRAALQEEFIRAALEGEQQ